MPSNYKAKGRGSKFVIPLKQKRSVQQIINAAQEQSQQFTDTSQLLPGPRSQPGYICFGGGIIVNAYDLGQIKLTDELTWGGLDHYVVPTLNIDPVITNRLNSISPLTFAEWNEFIDKIFEVDIADWKTKYRKLDADLGYLIATDLYIPGFDGGDTVQGKNYVSFAKDAQRSVVEPIYFSSDPEVPVDKSKFSSVGIKVPKPIEILAMLSPGAFNHGQGDSWAFVSGADDPTAVKITETRDYNADAVTSLSLTGNVDLFLVPLIALSNIHASAGDDDYEHRLIGVFEPISREKLAYSNIFDEDLGAAPLSKPFGYFAPAKPISEETMELIVSYYKSRTGATYYRTDVNTGLINDFFDPAAFDPSMGDFFDLFLNASDEFVVPNYEGLLLAVIKSGTKVYYVWNKYTDVVFRDSNGAGPIWMQFDGTGG